MPTLYYDGKPAPSSGPRTRRSPVGGSPTPDAAPEELNLPSGFHDQLNRPEGYAAEPGLVRAVNVALILGQPLLLTGEPGVGKTQLAYAVSHQLCRGAPPLRTNVKSTTTARDLFYEFDELRRFRDRQCGEIGPPTDYLRFNALGRAILLAGGPDATATPMEATGAPVRFDQLLPPDEFPDRPVRSVVLLDEMDKAPRDVPNDMLDEIEEMRFAIPELRLMITAPKSRRPIIIITSNSEKHLPDAFLRRCAYYDIPFPKITDPDQPDPDGPDGPDKAITVRDIIAARVSELKTGGALIDDALDVFARLRDHAAGLSKRPGVAELLHWLLLLLRDGPLTPNQPLHKHPDLATAYLSALTKHRQDQPRVEQVVARWLTDKGGTKGGVRGG